MVGEREGELDANLHLFLPRAEAHRDSLCQPGR